MELKSPFLLGPALIAVPAAAPYTGNEKGPKRIVPRFQHPFQCAVKKVLR
jgi:hypothetical protein